MEVNLFKTELESLLEGTEIQIHYNGHSFIEWATNFKHIKVIFIRWRNISPDDEYFIAEIPDRWASLTNVTGLHNGSKIFGPGFDKYGSRYGIIHKSQIAKILWNSIYE